MQFPQMTLKQSFITIALSAFLPLCICAWMAYNMVRDVHDASQYSTAMQHEVVTFNTMRVANLDAVLAAMDSIVDKQEGHIQPERMEIMRSSIALIQKGLEEHLQSENDADEKEQLEKMLAFMSEYTKAMTETLPNLISTNADGEAFSAVDDAIDKGGEVIGEGLLKMADEYSEKAGKALQNVEDQLNRSLMNIVLIAGGLGALLLVMLLFIQNRIALILRASVDSTAHVASLSQQMSHNLGEVDTINKQQADALHQIASATEESAATVTQITQQAQKTASNTRSIEDAVGHIVGLMDTLRDSAQGITGASQIIRAISEQTNLLALNAAIEVARAGEAGRGFAVVADEVRKLASTTNSSTVKIEESAKNLQESIIAVDGAMGQITGSLSVINDDVGMISTALNQQSASVKQIAETVHEFTAQMEKIGHNISQASHAAGTLSDDADKLNKQINVLKS